MLIIVFNYVRTTEYDYMLREGMRFSLFRTCMSMTSYFDARKLRWWTLPLGTLLPRGRCPLKTTQTCSEVLKFK